MSLAGEYANVELLGIEVLDVPAKESIEERGDRPLKHIYPEKLHFVV